MIARAMKNGIDASYILMDSWFTQQPLIKELTDQGLDVIGMVKKLKQHYLVNGERVSLDQLFVYLRQPMEKMEFYGRFIQHTGQWHSSQNHLYA